MTYPYDNPDFGLSYIYWPVFVLSVFCLMCFCIKDQFGMRSIRSVMNSVMLMIFCGVFSFMIGSTAAFGIALFEAPDFLNTDHLWWQAEEPARHMIDQLRYEKTLGKDWPRNDEELRQRFGKDMDEIESRAGTRYFYDNQSQQFYFLVQPGKNCVILFSSVKDIEFVRYKLAKWNGSCMSSTLYPPTVPGPWDKLLQLSRRGILTEQTTDQ